MTPRAAVLLITMGILPCRARHVEVLTASNWHKTVFEPRVTSALIGFWWGETRAGEPKCGACDTWSPHWMELGEKFEESPDILIASVDCNDADASALCTQHNVSMAVQVDEAGQEHRSPTFLSFMPPDPMGQKWGWEGQKRNDLFKFGEALLRTCYPAAREQCSDEGKALLRELEEKGVAAVAKEVSSELRKGAAMDWARLRESMDKASEAGKDETQKAAEKAAMAQQQMMMNIVKLDQAMSSTTSTRLLAMRAYLASHGGLAAATDAAGAAEEKEQHAEAGRVKSSPARRKTAEARAKASKITEEMEAAATKAFDLKAKDLKDEV